MERGFKMNRSEVSYSNLTNDQLEDLKALEEKFNTSSNGQETILIAYTNPK